MAQRRFHPMLSKEQTELLRLEYFDRANDSAYVFDFKDGSILDANNHITKLLGYTREELLQLTVFDIHPAEEHDRMVELIGIFAHVGQVKGLSDMHLKTKDGELIPVEKNGTLFPLNGLKVIQCTCRDITERKRFEAELNRRIEDMHILNAIALEITSGLELGELLARITQNSVKLLNADAGGIGLYDPRRGTLSYRYLDNLPENLSSIEIPRGAGLTSYVIETGRPISIPDYMNYPKALQEFKEAGLRGTAIAPLLFENNLLGTLVIGHTNSEKRFNEYDIGLLEAVARQAAIAIYNAQLFEEMKDEGEFREALNQLTSLIGSALDMGKVYDLICEEATKLFRNSGTYLYTVDEENSMLIGKAAYGEKAGDFLKVALPLHEPSMASYIYHTRKPILIDDATNNPLVKPEMSRSFTTKTLMGVPITVDGQVKSVLVFASSEHPYFFNEVQLERAKILSNQIAFAIKNADLYEQTKLALEHERYVAVTLQQSLLPEELPQVKETDFGVYYAPTSASASLVGGDFYDLIQLSDGKVAVVIGDVSGKGIEAAATTAMVKYAVRSFLYSDPTPSAVFTKANTVVCQQLKIGSFVTLCYALYDPKTGKLELVNAGHPYPIHFSGGDGKSRLAETYNPVFGVLQNHAYSQIELQLKAGDILALYTDGLIEARIANEFFGTERAEASVAKNHGLSAQSIATNLVYDCEEFAQGHLVDDVAILVLKRHA